MEMMPVDLITSERMQDVTLSSLINVWMQYMNKGSQTGSMCHALPFSLDFKQYLKLHCDMLALRLFYYR